MIIISNFIPASTQDNSYLHDIYVNNNTSEPIISGDPLPIGTIQEDLPLQTTPSLNPNDYQENNELINIKNTDIDNYDISDTEAQEIGPNSTLDMPYLEIPEGQENKINEPL